MRNVEWHVCISWSFIHFSCHHQTQGLLWWSFFADNSIIELDGEGKMLPRSLGTAE